MRNTGSYEELERESIYLQPGLPKNKPLRLLTLSSVGSVADGGTQVRNSSEIGKISILPIEQKEGMTLIHLSLSLNYQLVGIHLGSQAPNI